MARVVAVVVFLAVAGYSAARFARSVTRRGPHTGVLAAGVPDLSHALMGLAMALMVSPAGPAVPAPLGIAAFTVLAAWFAVRLRHDGPLARAALPAQGAAGRTGAVQRRTDLTQRDRRSTGHGGYHLHQLVSCAAMVVMYLTGHGALAAEAAAATTAAGVDAAATVAPRGAATLDAHGAFGAHATMPALASLSWVFGLYFLVAATSLGFRVGEPAARPAPAGPSPRPGAARVLTSATGACAAEVALSAGMAVLFFSAL